MNDFSNLKIEEQTPTKVDKATNVREILRVDKEGLVTKTEVRLSN